MGINIILSTLLEQVMSDCWSEDRPKTKGAVEKIRLYLGSHYMESITLESLSQNFFLERTYIIHMFSRMTGSSPIKYLTVMRIQKPKEFLRFIDKSLAKIAEKVGFSSVHYLSRVFKGGGISPREYRK